MNSLELQLEAGVSHQTWVLGCDLRLCVLITAEPFTYVFMFGYVHRSAVPVEVRRGHWVPWS